MLKKIVKTLAISLCAAALITALPFQATAKLKNLSKSVKVGDTVYFGHYEQDGNTENGKEKIEWIVLDKKGDKALLISKKVLDLQPYNKEDKDVTWEKCTLRKWLNKDFIKAAFSTKERKKIKKSKIENKDNIRKGEDGWHMKGGKNTIDKVFLLSIDEAYKYYKTYEKRTAEITNYGIKRLAEVWGKSEKNVRADFSENKNMWYWLRSPGHRRDFAATVNDGGSVSESGGYVDDVFVGVRPAIWVNL